MINSVYLLRHGMRLDIDDKMYWPYYAKRPHDTPLSHNGIQQATENADFLKDAGVKHIFCSPFFRTIQTANIVADKLGLQVNIEHGFIELLNSDWFNDFPDIIPNDEAKIVFSNVNKDYKSFVRPQFPETSSEVDVFVRVKQTMEYIFEYYEEGPILIVGHGASMWETARSFVDPPEGFNTKMCALNHFIREEEKWRLVLSTTDHLSYIDKF
ncbi:MAG: Phosphoglycerate mutase [Bacilli bacterium]|nr:Phosphoglycerate mutase [Bacilli bacterium]